MPAGFQVCHLGNKKPRTFNILGWPTQIRRAACYFQLFPHPFAIPAHLLEALHWGLEALRPRFLVLPKTSGL